MRYLSIVLLALILCGCELSDNHKAAFQMAKESLFQGDFMRAGQIVYESAKYTYDNNLRNANRYAELIGNQSAAAVRLSTCVIMDMMNGANLLIRGMDLISEHCLYMHLCDRLGLPFPRMVYLPRLCLPGGGEVLPGVSKTEGNYQIKQLREQGWEPGRIIDKLRKSCVINQAGSWLIDNIKRQPIWIG